MLGGHTCLRGSRGIWIAHCLDYVRSWIAAERGAPSKISHRARQDALVFGSARVRSAVRPMRRDAMRIQSVIRDGRIGLAALLLVLLPARLTAAQASAGKQDPEVEIGQEVFQELKAKGEIIESSPLYDV